VRRPKGEVLLRTLPFGLRTSPLSSTKLFSDPVHGFHAVPRALLPLVDAPEVQRLRRIRQLGVGYLVFPGAEHSRFGHALGTMALLGDVLTSLEAKGVRLSSTERLAALAAALLHDVGHGPFSHTLEHGLLAGAPHEAMSRALIGRMQRRFAAEGSPLAEVLALTRRIFDGAYERPFLHDLVSGQLDVDRLDYLRRDAFYTGVVEGQVGVDRLVKTLAVQDDGAGERLVVEAKGAYAVENFLNARRLMYGQVYLHKTVLAGDQVLRAALARAKACLGDAEVASGTSDALRFFLDAAAPDLGSPAVQEAFLALDDAEVTVSLKRWRRASDPVLADLAGSFLDRRLPAVTRLPAVPDADERWRWVDAVAAHLAAQGIGAEHAAYYLAFGETKSTAYDPDVGAIWVLERSGSVQPFVGEHLGTGGSGRGAYVVHPKGVRPAADTAGAEE